MEKPQNLLLEQLEQLEQSFWLLYCKVRDDKKTKLSFLRRDAVFHVFSACFFILMETTIMAN